MYAGVFLQLHGNLRNNVIVLRNQSAFRLVPTYRRWQLVDGFSFDSPFIRGKKGRGTHLSFEIGNARWIFLKRTTHTHARARTPLLYLVIGRRQGIALFYSSVYNTCASPVIKSTSTSDVSTGAYRLPTELPNDQIWKCCKPPLLSSPSLLSFAFPSIGELSFPPFLFPSIVKDLSQLVVPTTTTPSRSPVLPFFLSSLVFL